MGQQGPRTFYPLAEDKCDGDRGTRERVDEDRLELTLDEVADEEVADSAGERSV